MNEYADRFIKGYVERDMDFSQPLYFPLVKSELRDIDGEEYSVPMPNWADSEEPLFLEVRRAVVIGVMKQKPDKIVDCWLYSIKQTPCLMGFLLSLGHCTPEYPSWSNADIEHLIKGTWDGNLRSLQESAKEAQVFIMKDLRSLCESFIDYSITAYRASRGDSIEMTVEEELLMIYDHMLEHELKIAEKAMELLPYLTPVHNLLPTMIRYHRMLLIRLRGTASYKQREQQVDDFEQRYLNHDFHRKFWKTAIAPKTVSAPVAKQQPCKLALKREFEEFWLGDKTGPVHANRNHRFECILREGGHGMTTKIAEGIKDYQTQGLMPKSMNYQHFVECFNAHYRCEIKASTLRDAMSGRKKGK